LEEHDWLRKYFKESVKSFWKPCSDSWLQG